MLKFNSIVKLTGAEKYLISEGFVMQLDKDHNPLYILNCGNGNLIEVNLLLKEVSFTTANHAATTKISSIRADRIEDELNSAFEEFKRMRTFKEGFGIEEGPGTMEVW